jgi:hypothetical protein
VGNIIENRHYAEWILKLQGEEGEGVLKLRLSLWSLKPVRAETIYVIYGMFMLMGMVASILSISVTTIPSRITLLCSGDTTRLAYKICAKFYYSVDSP